MISEIDVQKYLDAYAAVREFLATTPIETHRYDCEWRAREAYKNILQIPEKLRTPDMQRDISRLEAFIDKKETETFQDLANLDGF